MAKKQKPKDDDLTSLLDYVMQEEYEDFLDYCNEENLLSGLRKPGPEQDARIEEIVRDPDCDHVYARACRLLYDQKYVNGVLASKHEEHVKATESLLAKPKKL